MNSWPVIVRELRAEARRPVNHWLRLLAAGAGIAVGVSLLATSPLPPMLLGGHLFATLHTTLFVTFLVVVPLMTADCVSQERREGTLGLLFLTPLTAQDIVAGKSLVHVLRALTLFLAVIPVLTLPFLMGGVGSRQALAAVGFEACAVVLGLAAGLLATSKGGTATQVMVWAEIYAVALAVLLGLASTATAGSSLWLARWFSTAATVPTRVIVLPNGNVVTVSGPSSPYAGPPTPVLLGPGRVSVSFNSGLLTANTFLRGQPFWLGPMGVLPYRGGPEAAGLTLLAGLLLLALAVSSSVRRLKRTWHEDAAAPDQPRWVKIFSGSEFWQAVFRWDKSRTLDRNPVAWLQEYSWTARLTKWGWCLVILVGELFVLLDWERPGRLGWQPALSWALLLSLAFSAVSSFRRERQAGLLELLLVTPLSAQQLIQGRLWGVWCHFLPATAILTVGRMSETALVAYPAGLRGAAAAALPLVSTYLALPVIGLYFSLWRVHVLVGWLLTVILGVLVPLAAVVAFYSMGGSEWRMDVYREAGFQVVTCWCAVQAGLATFAARQLYENLIRREFALQAT